MTVADLIEHLHRNHSSDEPIAYSLWGAGDVRCLAEQEGRRQPSDDECREIIEAFHRYHDAEYGLNWQTLSAVIHDRLEVKGGAA